MPQIKLITDFNLKSFAAFLPMLLALLIVTTPATVIAQIAGRSNLNTGMTKSEVQARWGQPDNVIDKALIGESSWTFRANDKYPEQTLIFNSSKLSQIVGGNPIINPDAYKILQQRKSTKVEAAQAFMPIVSQKDLTDVLKEVPSEDDEKKADKPAQASPARFN